MTLEGILVIVYIVLGTSAVKYVKSEIFGVVVEFGSLGQLLLKNVIWGVILGWLAIPVAIIHMLIFHRD
ncbi:MAG: hypothetical protein J1F11_06550 [Oscillospiraceae bacterium]|nr:hypothetical protein [Oscillospiraceae bacterium]